MVVWGIEPRAHTYWASALPLSYIPRPFEKIYTYIFETKSKLPRLALVLWSSCFATTTTLPPRRESQSDGYLPVSPSVIFKLTENFCVKTFLGVCFCIVDYSACPVSVGVLQNSVLFFCHSKRVLRLICSTPRLCLPSVNGAEGSSCIFSSVFSPELFTFIL